MLPTFSFCFFPAKIGIQQNPRLLTRLSYKLAARTEEIRSVGAWAKPESEMQQNYIDAETNARLEGERLRELIMEKNNRLREFQKEVRQRVAVMKNLEQKRRNVEHVCLADQLLPKTISQMLRSLSLPTTTITGCRKADYASVLENAGNRRLGELIQISHSRRLYGDIERCRVRQVAAMRHQDALKNKERLPLYCYDICDLGEHQRMVYHIALVDVDAGEHQHVIPHVELVDPDLGEPRRNTHRIELVDPDLGESMTHRIELTDHDHGEPQRMTHRIELIDPNTGLTDEVITEEDYLYYYY